MRVTDRLRDESGATAVIVAILIVALVGMLALTVDGGLLWAKYRRIRTANDAAALKRSMGLWMATALVIGPTSATSRRTHGSATRASR